MMKFGLTEKAIAAIVAVFQKHPDVTKVEVFGSRAMGNYRDNSDIDLVIYGNINDKTLAKISAELEDLPLPYSFDIQSYTNITHDGLMEHIKLYGKTLYN